MNKINVELVTPEILAFSGEADMVVIPGSEGDLGILYNHSPLILRLRPGVVAIHDNGQVHEIFVSGGFAEVTNDRCTLLADESTDISDVSKEDRLELIRKAEENL